MRMDLDRNLVYTIIVLLVLLVLGGWVIPYYRIKWAVPKVIDTLRQHGAVTEESAKFLWDMGLGVPTLQRRLLRTRDYRPQATEVLIRAAIVAVCDDGRVFLVEENYQNSKLFKPGYTQ
jgi:hypothetical protein